MPTITTKDGTEIFYKDWGRGQPVVFSHGWPLSADMWEAQMFAVASAGFRAVAHDRRGHGRSSQPWEGNDMDTYADDLAALLEALDLRDVVLVGHSTGGGEVTRYIGRHGTGRVAKLVLVGAVTPKLLRTPERPAGVPRELLDELRQKTRENRAQLYRDMASGPFFGFNRPGAEVSEAIVDGFVWQSMRSSFKGAYDCIAAFSETDFTDDLRKVDVPTLIIHGSDDQIVPIDATAREAAKLVAGAELVVYEGAPHAIPETDKERLERDLLRFLREERPAAKGKGKGPAEARPGA